MLAFHQIDAIQRLTDLQLLNTDDDVAGIAERLSADLSEYALTNKMMIDALRTIAMATGNKLPRDDSNPFNASDLPADEVWRRWDAADKAISEIAAAALRSQGLEI